MRKSLLELRTKGFNKLKSGRIHLRCFKCGRKHSNSIRAKTDPPEAFLLEILCDKCGMGCKDGHGGYFDELGNELDYEDYITN